MLDGQQHKQSFASSSSSGEARALTPEASPAVAPPTAQRPRVVTRASGPLATQSGRSVILPIGLIIVVFTCSLFAYFHLIAPARIAHDELARTTGRSGKPAVVEAAEPVPRVVSLAPLRMPAAEPDEVEASPPQSSVQPNARQRVSDSLEAPRLSSPQARVDPSSIPPKTPAVRPAERREQSARFAVRQDSVPSVRLDAPTASGATQSAAVEMKLLPSEPAAPAQPVENEPPTAAPPVQKQPSTPAVRMREEHPTAALPVQKEYAAAARPAQKEHAAAAHPVQQDGSAAAPPPQNEQLAVARPAPKEQPVTVNSWVTRMRAELDRCGKPGILRHDLCREATRWNYCHPNRWGTVGECVVERFASNRAVE